LISESGEQLGIKSIDDALRLAYDSGMDLVEVAPQASPPVCRIMDYSKYKYEQTQKMKKAKRHSATMILKEMKLRPKIDNHDFEVKKKHVVRFLEDGAKVKVTIMFRGRELTHTELGRKLLDRIADEVKEVGKIEAYPKLDGRNMIMVLAPVPKVVPAPEAQAE
jgi:translation initiation factor IF-3